MLLLNWNGRFNRSAQTLALPLRPFVVSQLDRSLLLTRWHA